MKETGDLASLIAPMTVADFFENYWEKELLHLKHNPGYFDRVLQLADIDDLLSQQNLLPDGIRLMNNGTAIAADDWTKAEKLIDGTIQTVVDPQKLYRHFNSGATIILNSAEKCIPRLAAACRVFEQELQLKVQANIYVTPPHSQGFSMHYDPHDIFLMQIKGPKTWQLYNSGEELPVKYRKFRQDPKLVLKVDIQSGDFLYMPRGTVHEAFASSVSTIHVNFSCRPRYGFHLIESLAELAEQEDVFFRKTVPHAYSTEEAKKAYMETFALKLAQLINTIPHQQLLEKQQAQFISQQTLDYKRYLLQSLQLEELTLNSRVKKREGFTCSVKTVGDKLRISFGAQQLIVPPFIDKAPFLKDDAFVIADLKGLATPDGKLALVKQFISAGFLEIVNEDL